MDADFDIYRRPLEMVTAFKYPGRVLTASYDYWPVVVVHLKKAQRRREQISRILKWEGVYPIILRKLYKAVVKDTLLFGEETWVMTPRIGKTLGGFHHRVAGRLEGIQPRQDTGGRWVYLPLDAAMAEVGLEEVELYILCRQNTVAHYIENCLILELCLTEERRTGA